MSAPRNQVLKLTAIVIAVAVVLGIIAFLVIG
jgi:multisubunit Na+/H+ antiporter MnhC subunit